MFRQTAPLEMMAEWHLQNGPAAGTWWLDYVGLADSSKHLFEVIGNLVLAIRGGSKSVEALDTLLRQWTRLGHAYGASITKIVREVAGNVTGQEISAIKTATRAQVLLEIVSALSLLRAAYGLIMKIGAMIKVELQAIRALFSGGKGAPSVSVPLKPAVVQPEGSLAAGARPSSKPSAGEAAPPTRSVDPKQALNRTNEKLREFDRLEPGTRKQMGEWWGNGPEGARAADPRRMPRISDEQLEAWRDLYAQAPKAGKGAATPAARLELLERAIAERAKSR